MRKLRNICVLLAASVPVAAAAACTATETRDLGGAKQNVFDARTIDATYREVGNLKGECTATVLPGNLILTAAHCGFVKWNTAASDDRMPAERLGKPFVYDEDGDPRTTTDRTAYAISGAFAVGLRSTNGPNWDIAIAALYVPPGQTGPWERARLNRPLAQHRIVTSFQNSNTPADIADWVVHVPFDPATVFSMDSAGAPVRRVGMGVTDLVLNADGGIIEDAHSDVSYNDGGGVGSAGPFGYRFLAPANARGLYDVSSGYYGRLGSRASAATDPYMASGDSGGPMLIHPSALVAGGSSVEEYIIGVLSQADTPRPVPNYAPWSHHAPTFDTSRGPWLEEHIRDLLADRDGDGIPAATDNCPNTPNADQANCNRDVEDIRRSVDPAAIPLGDACDPVPCPGTTRTALDNAPPTETVCGSGNRLAGRFCFGRRIRPQLSLSTVGSHPREDVQLQNPSPPTARGYVVANVPTKLRFCASNPDLGVECETSANVRREKALLDDPGGATPGLWWRIGFSDNDFANGDALAYGSTTRTLTWDYVANATSWAASGHYTSPAKTAGCTVTGASPGHDGICLNGSLWTLGDSLVGADSAHANYYGPLVGNINTLRYVGYHADHISASITRMNPDYTGGYYGPGIGWEEAFRRPIIHTLGEPSWWTNTSTVPFVRNEAVVLSAVNNNALIVHADGDAESMGASVSGALYDVLAEFETMSGMTPTQQWIDLADPQTREDRPLAVVARKQSNGTWKFDSVLDYYGGLNLESDYGNPLRYGSVTALPSTPMVYSPTDDALWTADTNVLLRHAAGATSFVNVLPANPDIKPANVKAVAFDAARQAAWVVDYTSTGVPRLLRFAKNSAGVWTGTILSQGTSAGSASDKHYLNLLPDGRVMYARTNVASNTRVVGRFAYSAGGVQATLLTGTATFTSAGGGAGIVTGALLARPLLDGTGYHQMIAGQDAPVSGDPGAPPTESASTYVSEVTSPPAGGDWMPAPTPVVNPAGPATAGYSSDDPARAGIAVPPEAVFP